MGNLVRVKYPNTQEVWNKVVVAAEESVVIDEENMEYFIAEYHSTKAWNTALIRFDGRVEHTVLS